MAALPPWLSENAVPLAIGAGLLVAWLRLRTRATPIVANDPPGALRELGALREDGEPVVIELFDNG